LGRARLRRRNRERDGLCKGCGGLLAGPARVNSSLLRPNDTHLRPGVGECVRDVGNWERQVRPCGGS